MRSAVGAAQNAANAAGTAAGGYNAAAGDIGANLIPFLTRQMTNPQGMSQRDIGAQMTASMAGSGGATSALTGAARAQGMRTRNPMGFAPALDEAARTAGRTVAGTGERIAANNADVKLKQQAEAASGLGGLYGMASKAGVGEGEVQAKDIEDMISANKTGWLQNFTDILNSVRGAGMKGVSI